MAQDATAAIQKSLADFVAAYNASNSAGIANVFTEDAQFITSDGPDVIGAENIGSWYQSWFDQFIGEHTVTLDEIQVLGDWAFSRGPFTVKLTPKAGGELLHITGKWLAINRVQPGGSWKIARIIFNVPSGVQPPGK